MDLDTVMIAGPVVASGLYGLRSIFNSKIKKLPRISGAFAAVTAAGAFAIYEAANGAGPGPGMVAMFVVPLLGAVSVSTGLFSAGAAYQSRGQQTPQP